jgi:hypothetical protein
VFALAQRRADSEKEHFKKKKELNKRAKGYETDE